MGKTINYAATVKLEPRSHVVLNEILCVFLLVFQKLFKVQTNPFFLLDLWSKHLGTFTHKSLIQDNCEQCLKLAQSILQWSLVILSPHY
jgi:hypothetical protein